MTRDNRGRYFDFETVENNFDRLINVEIGKHTVSKESMEEIEEILGLWDRTGTELRAVRNAVVKTFIKKRDEALKKEDFTTAWDWETKISGITAVIDHVLWDKGFEV